MFASLKTIAPKTGEASPAQVGSLFPISEPDGGATLSQLLRRFPDLPPRVTVALAVLSLLERSVTPFRLCACGCGSPVHGKARLASAACRKRLQRERDSMRSDSPRQFNLTIQHEMHL